MSPLRSTDQSAELIDSTVSGPGASITASRSRLREDTPSSDGFVACDVTEQPDSTTASRIVVFIPNNIPINIRMGIGYVRIDPSENGYLLGRPPAVPRGRRDRQLLG